MLAARPKNLVATRHDLARARQPESNSAHGTVPALRRPDSSVGAIQPGMDPAGAFLRMTAWAAKIAPKIIRKPHGSEPGAAAAARVGSSFSIRCGGSRSV